MKNKKKQTLILLTNIKNVIYFFNLKESQKKPQNLNLKNEELCIEVIKEDIKDHTMGVIKIYQECHVRKFE